MPCFFDVWPDSVARSNHVCLTWLTLSGTTTMVQAAPGIGRVRHAPRRLLNGADIHRRDSEELCLAMFDQCAEAGFEPSIEPSRTGERIAIVQDSAQVGGADSGGSRNR